MQYLKRIVTPSKRSTGGNDPLATFTRLWAAVQALLAPEAAMHLDIEEAELPRRFQLMADLLVSEYRHADDTATGPCMEFLLKHDVLGHLARLGLEDRPEGAKGETIRFFASLVVLLDERFLVHNTVHRPLVKLLHGCIQPDGADGVASVSVEYEADLVDLLSFVANRIRSFPELLPIFFHSRSLRSPRKAPRTHQMSSIEQRIFDVDPPSSPARDGRLSPASSEASTAPSSSEPTTTSRITSPGEYEFLIFGYLLRFLHREGRIGDLARAGLLFIIDVAMSAGTHPLATAPPPGLAEATLALAEYLLDSDFADVLGAGMGALYGLLPTKLSIRPHGSILGDMGGPRTTAGQDVEASQMAAQGVGDAKSREFTDAMAIVLKMIAFAQDVLQRIPSSVRPVLDTSTDSDLPAISSVAQVGAILSDNILGAVKRIFLESVLYPSILECSDRDGSAVAVVTYLDAMLSVIEGDSAFSNVVLDYLMEEDDAEDRPVSRDRASRRKSNALLLVEGITAKRDTPSVYTSLGRYSLRDLLLQQLTSSSEPARTAGLHFLATLQVRHSRHADLLLDLAPSKDLTVLCEEDEELDEATSSGPTEPRAAKGVVNASTVLLLHAAEMADLLQVLDIIDPSAPRSDDGAPPGLSTYMQDAERLVALTLVSSGPPQQLKPAQAILKALFDGLNRFFEQGADCNLALTSTLTAIAACPSHSLDAWLLPPASTWNVISIESGTDAPRSGLPAHDDDGDDRSLAESEDVLPSADVPPRWGSDRSAGLVFSIIEMLANKVAQARNIIADFDDLLAERRKSLLFVDSLADALTDMEPHAPISTKSTPSKKVGKDTARGRTSNPFSAHYARTAATPAPFGNESGNLSMFLDNVVVLEEAVKELVAVVQCRRAFGIDSLLQGM